MIENKLLTRRLTISRDEADNHLVSLLTDWLANDVYLYSYLVRCKIKDGEIISYNVQVCTSQIDRYNTILKQEVILDIVSSINAKTQEIVIGYGQPPLEVMCEAYEPLVNKLANQMAKKWNQDYDDMRQMCYLCMCTLYHKGYYLNKYLLTTTFVNEILVSMRKEYHQRRGLPNTDVSLYRTDKETGLILLDMIEDEQQYGELQSIEDNDEKSYEKERRIKLLKEEIGQRKYDDLVLKWKTGTLSNGDRTYMCHVGKRLRGKLWKNN